jgi:hypothetical protein
MKRFALHENSKETNELITKAVTVKVFALGNGSFTKRVLRARPGQGFTQNAVDGILESVADDLELRFPAEDFGFVQIGPNSFNFVHRGRRGETADQ